MLRHFKRKWRPIPLVALGVVIWVLLVGTVAAIQSRSDPPLISFELEESTEPSTVQSVDLPPVVLQLTTEEAAQARISPKQRQGFKTEFPAVDTAS